MVAVAAEGTGVPSGASFVALDTTVTRGFHKYLEVSPDVLSFVGTVAATAVKLGIWRRSGGRIDKVGTIDITSGTALIPPVFDFFGEEICVRVESFTGGTAPAITGGIYVRDAERF